MENTGSTGQAAPKRRHRKIRTLQLGQTSSSVSSRLHPDFDPIKNVTQAPLAENIREDINQKTATSEALLELLQPTFISEYLEKILHFLNGSQKEICFPKIAPFKKAYLEGIAKDNTLLKSAALDEKNRQLGAEILEVLERNKNVFKWIHTYEDGIVNKNVLVYKKQFIDEAQKTLKQDLSSNPSSLASILEEMSLTKKNVKPAFRINFLNTTLKFLKDANRLILEYPQMTSVEGRYVYLILSYCISNGSPELGLPTMDSALHVAIKDLEKEFVFNLSFTNSKDLTATTIVLEKVPKGNGHQNKKGANLAESKINTALPESFLTQTMAGAVEFFENDAIVSTHFKNLHDANAQFVTSLPRISQQEHLHHLFSPDCSELLRRIKVAYKKDTWKLQINVSKTCKKTFTKTITYIKEPFYAPKENATKPDGVRKELNAVVETKPKDALVRKDEPAEKLPNKQAKVTESAQNQDKKAVSNNTKGKKPSKFIEFQSAGVDTVDCGPSDVPAEPLASDVINMLSEKKRKFFAGLATPLESDRAERMMRIMGWQGGALGTRGEGIIEPIVPAVHLKPGAGLGHVPPAQEQGTSQFKSQLEFRVMLLKEILSFIEGSENVTEVTFKEPLKKKEIQFVNRALNSFKQRKQFGLQTPEEKFLIATIIDKLLLDLRLLIEFCFNENTTGIYLAKHLLDSPIKLPKKRLKNTLKSLSDVYANSKNDAGVELISLSAIYGTTSNKSGDKNGAGIVKNGLSDAKNDLSDDKNDLSDVKNDLSDDKNGLIHVKRDNIDTISMEAVLEVATELVDCSTTLKQAKKIAFHLLFLEKLRRFLIHNNEECEIKLDGPINKKHSAFISGVVSEINKKRYTRLHTGVENDMYREVQRVSIDCYLIFSLKYHKIVLQKKFYQKRFTNSALEPPKSKDIENTIIYKDNVAYRPKTIEDIDNALSLNDIDKNNDAENNNDEIINDSQNDSNVPDDGCDVKIIYDSDDTMSVDKTDQSFSVESDDLISFDSSSDSDVEDSQKENNNSNDNLENKNNLKVSLNVEVNNNFKDDYKNDVPNLSSCDNLHFQDCSTLDTDYIKQVLIVPEDGGTIDDEKARKVQKMISDNISLYVFLPRLECNGIQNGGLAYTCHNQKTLEWLKYTLSVASDVRIIDTEVGRNAYKVKIKINSFVPESADIVFQRIQLYNPGLVTNGWSLLKEETSADAMEFTVILDENSFKFICERGCSLFMGVDKAKFSILWD